MGITSSHSSSRPPGANRYVENRLGRALMTLAAKEAPPETAQKVVDQAMALVERIRGKSLAPEASHGSSHEG